MHINLYHRSEKLYFRRKTIIYLENKLHINKQFRKKSNANTYLYQKTHWFYVIIYIYEF